MQTRSRPSPTPKRPLDAVEVAARATRISRAVRGMCRRAPRSFATIVLVGALLTASLSLAGCGQKGPLYLPNPQNKKVPAAQRSTPGHPAQHPQGAAPTTAAPNTAAPAPR